LNLFGVHPEFFLRGEDCEQVVCFPGFGVLVVISFAVGQLWDESVFDCLIGFVEYLNTFANIVKRAFNRPFDARLPGFVDAVHEVGGDRDKLSVLGTPARR